MNEQIIMNTSKLLIFLKFFFEAKNEFELHLSSTRIIRIIIYMIIVKKILI